MPRTCFIIGPIGEPGSDVRQAADDFMQYIVNTCPALKELDYSEPIRADQLNEPGRITSQVIKLLIEAELVIADLTGNNPNVYYELSLRHAIGKPVIHMKEDDTILSFDVRDNRTISYTMHARIAENASAELARQIHYVHSEGYKASNPILETAGVITLEHSSEPQRDMLLQLAQRMESLDADMKTILAQTRPTPPSVNYQIPPWWPAAQGTRRPLVLSRGTLLGGTTAPTHEPMPKKPKSERRRQE
jgi:hypothetical protein